MMKTPVTFLEIENFKSIRHIKLDLKRINIFIGKPNVGKSNILEAASLLGAGYEKNYEKFLSSFIRYENFSNLYYDNDWTNNILIKSNLSACLVRSFFGDGSYSEMVLSEDLGLIEEIQTIVDMKRFKEIVYNANMRIPGIKEPLAIHKTNTFSISKSGNTGVQELLNDYESLFKKYTFQSLNTYNNQYVYHLLPPYGDNLFSVLNKNKNLLNEIAGFFEEYKLDFIIRTENNKVEIQKKIERFTYNFPYNSTADTLRRIIFYFAAIETNSNSVLILEEPEAHAYPPYTRMLGDRIAGDEENQYLITTHSPYLLQAIIENADYEDINIFITHYENYETKVELLSMDAMRDILSSGFDIFFSLQDWTYHGG
jgi:AAA15 family ATPase/GTPase